MIKNPYLERQRVAGKILTQLLEDLRDIATAGSTLQSLEDFADQFLRMQWCTGPFKWYHSYPANLCLSVNDCVVHGVPTDYVVQNGDVLKIDAGVNYQWWLADAAVSVVIGWEKYNEQWSLLIRATKEALDTSLLYVKAGRSVYDFGFAVAQYMRQKWFSIIKNLTGHGIGKTHHENPFVYNYGDPLAKKIFFQEGQVVCLEPITWLVSTQAVEKNRHPFNLYCNKGDIGVQWEYMVLVTKGEPEILAGIQL